MEQEQRFKDVPYLTFSTHSTSATGIWAKCPHCSALGMVRVDDNYASFVCHSCSYQLCRERTCYLYDVHTHCSNCERYYRVDISDHACHNRAILKVKCPYCGALNAGKVHKMAHGYQYSAPIKHGHEPFLGLELWFLASFKGKLVWALNREHLNYLISYIGAELREKERFVGAPCKVQSDLLPAFMKSAKNRTALLKLLQRMQAL